MRRLRVSMSTKHRLPSWLANRKRGSSHFPAPSAFGTLPFLDGDRGAAQTGRGNGLPGPGGQVLYTAKCIVEPDRHPTPTSQLATTAADYPPRPHSLSDSQTANRLGTFLTNWKLLTSDKWTLQAVTGYKIPFLRTSRQWRPRPTVTKVGQQSELMRESIQSVISKGAITVVAPHTQQFISTVFLVEKGQGTGEFRPVINLRALNRFLPKEKFKMEGLHTARSLLRSGDFMMKLDLKDAYYAVAIHQDSRKYLRFQFEGTTFEFRCLPFGLSLAPWVFTRILRPVVAKLRSEGVRTVMYLDDHLLLIHHQNETLMEIFYYVQKLLSSLGFVVTREKCSPASTRQLIFLGAVLDTNQMSLALPGEQIDRIQTVCQQILETGSTTLGELASLLGRMSHAARTGLWEAPLHYRALQRQQDSLLHRVGWRPKTPISLNPPSLEDLEWWLSPTLHSHNRQDITPPPPPPLNLTVRTYASLRGWAATYRGSTTGGRWSVEEQGQHINYLELKAAFLALRSFLGQGGPAPTRCWDQHPPRHILLEMDNTTAVAYVNRRGGMQSPTLSLLALDLWSFLLERGSWITARHLPGA